ncbi:MAG: ATP-binding cassette domain-containing protein [Bacilli bacterium]|nr:ATP-binding cassette domain-containing protein [Bacilli bacterium]
MLKVENIVKYYGKNCAVNGLSFEVKNGEIFGLLGENGAGKTTTFRIIMGLLDSDSGSVSLDGRKIDYSVTDEIGFLTEERSLLTKMTVKEQLLYYGALKGLEEDEILKRMRKLLKEFQIEEYENRKIKELSKGNQQKIQFIAAIINNPKLLILDEPFTGLDPINVDLFKKHIRQLQKKGCSIIFSSHQMEHIEEFCEKLVILVKGKSILEGYITDIKKEYRKQNIFIKGDINKEEIEKIPGVIEVIKNIDEYTVKIENDTIVSKVFKKVSSNNITKFLVEEASLNEIFIAKVGEVK